MSNLKNARFHLLSGGLYNEKEELIAVVPEGVSIKTQKIIEHSAELYEKVSAFVKDVNENGIFKPRAKVKEFEELISKMAIE